jgi:acyl-CoA synthetase (AMP-forming)/AMP-acid ligase II
MQDRPLVLPHILHRAEQLFGHKTLVTGTVGGESTTTVADWAVRVRRLAAVLDALDVPADGRVATFCWNSVEFIDEVPKTSVGKFSKRTLREKFAGYRLPDAAGAEHQ